MAEGSHSFRTHQWAQKRCLSLTLARSERSLQYAVKLRLIA
jgi:hypothetical protein